MQLMDQFVYVVQLRALEGPERWLSISAHLTEGEATAAGYRARVDLDQPVWAVRIVRQQLQLPPVRPARNESAEDEQGDE